MTRGDHKRLKHTGSRCCSTLQRKRWGKMACHAKAQDMKVHEREGIKGLMEFNKFRHYWERFRTQEVVELLKMGCVRQIKKEMGNKSN